MARYRRARTKHNKKKNNKKHPKPEKAVASAANAPNLLTIPGELRNKIYRLALTTANKINVDKGQFAEPGLLPACRQVRTEAVKIYYLENEWQIQYRNWDHSIAEAFFKHVRFVCAANDISAMKSYWINSGS